MGLQHAIMLAISYALQSSHLIDIIYLTVYQYYDTMLFELGDIIASILAE